MSYCGAMIVLFMTNPNEDVGDGSVGDKSLSSDERSLYSSPLQFLGLSLEPAWGVACTTSVGVRGTHIPFSPQHHTG